MEARTSNFENFYFLIEIHCTSMYICLYLSAAPKPALVPANLYNNNAAIPYSNSHTKFDEDGKELRIRARTSNFENVDFLI